MNRKPSDENKLQGRSAGRATLERLAKQGLLEEVQPRWEAEQGQRPWGRRVVLALITQ